MGLKELKSSAVSWIRANLVFVAAVAVLLLVTVTFGGYKFIKYMETPEFCSISICHSSMGPYSELFKQSAHGQRKLGYKCMECHGETRIATIQNKQLGVLLSHALDSPPIIIAVAKGKKPHPEFNPIYPILPSERCLRCHAPDAKGKDAFPVTAEDHSKPIDVSEQFRWVLKNPRGFKYQCKICHSFVVHPTDSKQLPTERGEKYEFVHPGFPHIELGVWQQMHWHLLTQSEKTSKLKYTYSGKVESEGEEIEYEIKAAKLKINGIERTLNHEMCEVCHRGERAPENIDGKCQGCHAKGEITKFEPEKLFHLPNPNDYIGARGIVGGGKGGH